VECDGLAVLRCSFVQPPITDSIDSISATIVVRFTELLRESPGSGRCGDGKRHRAVTPSKFIASASRDYNIVKTAIAWCACSTAALPQRSHRVWNAHADRRRSCGPLISILSQCTPSGFQSIS
jgi:hypothetical protein